VAIAAGQIAGAAARVETALAGLLSLAISFLAGFLGLGNVAEKIMGVIKKGQVAIDKALDKAVEWIVAQARRLGQLLAGTVQSARQRLASWWRTRKSFATNSESHSLFFTGEGPQARLTVKSIQRPLDDYVERLRVKITTDPAFQ